MIMTSAGITTTSDTTSGAMNLDYGVRVAKDIVIFGGAGRLINVEPSVGQQAVDTTVSTLAASNVAVTGTGRTPVWYADAGVRYLIPAGEKVMPYVFGALGVGRATPSARFTYAGTTSVSGGTANIGDDATMDVQSNGFYTAPGATWGAVIRAGGGVQIPIRKALAATVGYDFTRINAATPINVGSLNFGVGVRF